MLKLRFRDGSRPDMWLVDSLVTIGKDASNKIVISSDTVAPFHAELKIKDNEVEFVHKAELKSSFINEALIALSSPLKPWDVIKLGEVELELVDPLINRSPKEQVAVQKTQVRPVLSEWLLQAQTVPFSGQLFPVAEKLTIGRDTQCDIAIPMPHISRRHAEVIARDGNLFVRDLASANGTFINGEKHAEKRLSGDDIIKIDEFKFKVIFTGDSSTKQKQAFQTSIRETQIQTEKEKLQAELAATMEKPKRVTREKAFFHIMEGDRAGEYFQVSSTGSAIGRMLGHHLSREESSVSARHVEVYKDGRFWTIKNNGAANGLLVNGRMTTRASLNDGDSVTIGGQKLSFQCKGTTPRQIAIAIAKKPLSFGQIIIALSVIGAAGAVLYAFVNL